MHRMRGGVRARRSDRGNSGGCLIIFSQLNAHNRRKKERLALLFVPAEAKTKQPLVPSVFFFCASIYLIRTCTETRTRCSSFSPSSLFSHFASPLFLTRRAVIKGNRSLLLVPLLLLPSVAGRCSLPAGRVRRCDKESKGKAAASKVDVSSEGLLGATMHFLVLSVISRGALSCAGLGAGRHVVKVQSSGPSSFPWEIFLPLSILVE